MSNFDKGNAFLGDVTSTVCIMMYRYYETTRYYIPKCQSMTRVLLIFMMLVLVYILYCEGIAKQLKIRTLNVKPQ
jgi:hypothetical protein